MRKLTASKKFRKLPDIKQSKKKWRNFFAQKKPATLLQSFHSKKY